MRLQYLAAFLAKHPKMRTLTIGESAAFPGIWLPAIRDGERTE